MQLTGRAADRDVEILWRVQRARKGQRITQSVNIRLRLGTGYHNGLTYGNLGVTPPQCGRGCAVAEGHVVTSWERQNG